MTDTWAAKVLDGVRRCHTPEGTYLHKDDALAAIARMDREMALDVLASSGQAQEAYAAQLAAEAERDALRERVARLEGALRHYRETLCEGFCGEDMWADEGHSHPEIQRDCGGCLAASVLLSAALTDGG